MLETEIKSKKIRIGSPMEVLNGSSELEKVHHIGRQREKMLNKEHN